MNKTIRTLAVVAAVAALAATGLATAASVHAVSANLTADGIEVLAATSSAPTGSVICGFKIDGETGTAIPVGTAVINPATGAATISFPLDTDHFRLDLRAANGALLASTMDYVVELIEQ
ncbi:MAG: hypothetical protein ACT4PV_14440 [Planctomycetaceae bacterium]